MSSKEELTNLVCKKNLIGYKAKVFFLVIIKPFVHKSYNLNCNNLEFAKLLIIYEI
jgi:hypothetical protein